MSDLMLKQYLNPSQTVSMVASYYYAYYRGRFLNVQGVSPCALSLNSFCATFPLDSISSMLPLSSLPSNYCHYFYITCL